MGDGEEPAVCPGLTSSNETADDLRGALGRDFLCEEPPAECLRAP